MAESASHHQIQFKLKFQKYLTSSKSLLCTLGCWFSTPTMERWSFCDKIKSIIFWLRSKIMGPDTPTFWAKLTDRELRIGHGLGEERRWFFNPRIERLLLSAGNDETAAASHPTSSPGCGQLQTKRQLSRHPRVSSIKHFEVYQDLWYFEDLTKLSSSSCVRFNLSL